MNKLSRLLLSLILVLCVTLAGSPCHVLAKSTSFPFLFLTPLTRELSIGDSFYLTGIASTGKLPTFKSSNSSLASVNIYGLVTAKKAGSVIITAKITGAQAYCTVTIKPTKIVLNRTNVSLEHGESFALSATTSTGADVTYKSSNRSIISVDETGLVEGLKPGSATIKVQSQGTVSTCHFTVKKPCISLDTYQITLYRNQRYQLKPHVSSGLLPSFRSSKSSIAVVDSYGYITAQKHGSAQVRVSLDGVTMICQVTVCSPLITLARKSLQIKKGSTMTLSVTVSSGNLPAFRSSNENIVTVSSSGEITGHKKGTAYVYVTEDGTKVSCKITVI